jgi:hypothetical protein
MTTRALCQDFVWEMNVRTDSLNSASSSKGFLITLRIAKEGKVAERLRKAQSESYGYLHRSNTYNTLGRSSFLGVSRSIWCMFWIWVCVKNDGPKGKAVD